MKLAVFSEVFYPHGSGAQLATYLYCSLLAKRGIEVKVLTHRFSGEAPRENINGLEVIRTKIFPQDQITSPFFLNFLATPILRKLIQKHIKSADVIHMADLWFSIIPLASLLEKPVVAHVHSYAAVCPYMSMFSPKLKSVCDGCYNPLDMEMCIIGHELSDLKYNAMIGEVPECFIKVAKIPLKMAKGCYEVFTYRSWLSMADRILCVSRACEDKLLQVLPRIRDKTCVIYNPLPRHGYIDPIEDSDVTLGYFGGASIVKGFHVLLKAMSKIKPRKSVKLLMTKVKGVKSVNRFINELHISDVVERLPFLPRKELLETMRYVDVCVVPSIWPEPLPYAATEMMSYGRPVIASNIGGLNEIVMDGVNGFLFPPSDAKSLTETIEKVASLNDKSIKEMGLNARNYVLEKFSDEKVFTKLISVYETVIP